MANYGNAGNMGAPGTNLTTVTVGGESWRVNRQAAPAFQGFLTDLAATGYNLKSSGGFNDRNKAGGGGKSQHAFGNAIDIDAPNNPFRGNTTNMPSNVNALAQRWGLEWGGTWSSRYYDPMHFEWTGRNTSGTAVAGGDSATPTRASASGEDLSWTGDPNAVRDENGAINMTVPGSGSGAGGGSGSGAQRPSNRPSVTVPEAIDQEREAANRRTQDTNATSTTLNSNDQTQSSGMFSGGLSFASDIFGRVALIAMGLIVLAVGLLWLMKNTDTGRAAAAVIPGARVATRLL